jgi:ATP-dependent RNA helicase DHX37/DHR1
MIKREFQGTHNKTKRKLLLQSQSTDQKDALEASEVREANDQQPNNKHIDLDQVLVKEFDDLEEETDLEDEELYGKAHEADSASDSDSDSDSDEEMDVDSEEAAALPQFVHVLPLYSLLSQENQLQVFQPVPPNHRLIVVATNVADTSLAIPNIKYVVDCGCTKERVFKSNNMSSDEVTWTSKASADQRAERAGRTSEGHSYRLFSLAVYDTEFPLFSSPEIEKTTLENLILQMKSIGIHNVDTFPFVSPPETKNLFKAIQILRNLGILEPVEAASSSSPALLTSDKAKTDAQGEILTEIGRKVSHFPIEERFGKMLLLVQALQVEHLGIAMVCALSSEHSPFIFREGKAGKADSNADEDNEEQSKEEAAN